MPSHRRKNPRPTRRHALITLFALACVLVVSRSPWSDAPRAESDRAAISRSGVLGGANYLIEVPANWQGGLVVFAHGIQRGPGPGTVGPPPIGSHILSAGHAWIASGYRAREYQPHLFIEDLIALRELFLKEIGPPRWTIIYGRSMGGHIVVASLELHPALYQGGMRLPGPASKTTRSSTRTAMTKSRIHAPRMAGRRSGAQIRTNTRSQEAP